MSRKTKMTRDQAIAKLRETRELSTALLAPLGIPFEFFLRFAQVPSGPQTEAVIDKLIARFSGGAS